MKTFKHLRLNEEILTEAFKNFIGVDTVEDRKIWADQVWDILQQTYKVIGGIKGSGFESVEAMITKIPFWKLYIEGKKVLVVVMYKDTGGRKMVAAGIDGSAKAKKILGDNLKEGLNVNWGEQSKAMIAFTMKTIGYDVIKPFLIKPADVAKVLKDEIFAATPDAVAELTPADVLTYDKFRNQLQDYFYIREIGGRKQLKVALGTLDKKIS